MELTGAGFAEIRDGMYITRRVFVWGEEDDKLGLCVIIM